MLFIPPLPQHIYQNNSLFIVHNGWIIINNMIFDLLTYFCFHLSTLPACTINKYLKKKFSHFFTHKYFKNNQIISSIFIFFKYHLTYKLTMWRWCRWKDHRLIMTLWIIISLSINVAIKFLLIIGYLFSRL